MLSFIKGMDYDSIGVVGAITQTRTPDEIERDRAKTLIKERMEKVKKDRGIVDPPAKKPRQKEVEDVGGDVPSKTFDKTIERVFRSSHPRVTVTVEFSASFNSTGGNELRVLDEKGEWTGEWKKDHKFKYIKYHALIRERVRGKLLVYKCEQDLTKDGKPTGDLKETLTYGGEPLDDKELMGKIHTGMNEHIIPKHGVIPMHGNFSIHYENIYNRSEDPNWKGDEPELYGGVHDFRMKHDDIYLKDEKHKEWESTKEKHEQRKDMGIVGDYEEVQKQISSLRTILKKEKDPAVRSKYMRQLKDYEEKLDKHHETREDVLKEDWDLLKSLGDDIKEHFKETFEGPSLKPQGERSKESIDYDSIGRGVIAIDLPGGGDDSKSLISLFKAYHLDMANWMDPHQLTLLMKKFKHEWDYRMNKFSAEGNEVGIKKLNQDAENLKGWMPGYIKDLKVRLSELKKERSSDYALLEKNRDIKWIDDDARIKEIIDMAENLFRVEKAENAFPGPKSESAQKLVHKLHAYGLTTNPKPVGWLVPSDLMILTRALTHLVADKIHKEMGEKKTKGTSQDEWKADRERVRKEYESDLKAFGELFPAFLKDLKARRDTYAKEFPLDYKGLKDVAWLDNDSAVKDLVEKIQEELVKTVTKEPGKIDHGGTNIIEHTKFDAIEGFLEANKLGFKTFGNRLLRTAKDNGLKPGGGDPDISKLKAAKDEVSHNLEAAIGKLNDKDLDLSKEELASLEESKKSWLSTLKDINSIISMRVAVPVIHPAKVLYSFIDYFSKIYSDFSRYVWMREKYGMEEVISYDDLIFEDIVVEAAATTFEDIQSAEVEGKDLVDDIYHECMHLYGLRIKNKAGIKSGLGMLKKMLQRLSTITTYLTSKRDDEDIKDVPAVGEKKAAEPKVYIPKEDNKKPEKTHDEARETYIVPESFSHESKQLIEKMKDHENAKVKAMASIAQKEYDKLVENLKELYKKGFTDDEIEDVAKKSGISPQKAAIRLHSHRNALNKAAMDAYVVAWTDVLSNAAAGMKLKPKEKSEMGNKHHKEYETLHHLVEKMKAAQPVLRHLSGDPELPEIPSPGIPTAERLKDDIMRASIPRKMDLTDKQKELSGEQSDMSPEEKAHFWKVEMTDAGFANGFSDASSARGGGGGKSKARPKPMKIPPPAGTKEVLEKLIVKQIKTKSAIDIVKEVIAIQVKNVMGHLTSKPEDQTLLQGDLIDGLVTELKNLHTFMMNMKIGPSSSQWDPPKTNIPEYHGPGAGGGQLKYTGTPDISIDNWKEAKEVYDKYIDIFNVINHYIAPDKVSTPPKDPKARPGKRELPPGLVDWYFHFKPGKEISNPEEMAKHHQPLPRVPSDEEALKKQKEQGKKFKEKYGKPKTPAESIKHPGFDYEKEINPRETKHSAVLYDYPTQMSMNVAAKFSGMDLPKDEIDAVLS